MASNVYEKVYNYKKNKQYKQGIKYLEKIVNNEKRYSVDTITWCYGRLAFFYQKIGNLQEEFDVICRFLSKYHANTAPRYFMEKRYEVLDKKLSQNKK